jgi:hypothetical protein
MELSEIESHFCGSSSVGHFFMDGADKFFDEAYLIDEIMNGKTKRVLKYDDYYEDNIIFYVPKGTRPTWTELKEICK